jgi:5-methyltetrahydrofolate--homocysteine methyltransferase
MNNKIPAAGGGIRARLDAIAAGRIIILDGAMGSLIQSYHLTEGDFRGERFAGHPVNLLGCNDLLCLTRPDLIGSIHGEYLKAGADITKTCSFNSTAISLEHFGLAGFAYEISRAAAALAREAADRFSTPEKPRFVAGSMGPTAKSGSISPDFNHPEKRAVTWNELVPAYYDNARGLVDGGADILLIETIIDTLNAKAAIFAIRQLLGERQLDLPIMLSATVASALPTGGRILAGQNLEAFCVSVAHAEPWALGLNCSFGAEALKGSTAELGAFAARLSGRVSGHSGGGRDGCPGGGSGDSWLISAHPNAGLPNQSGGYDESPESMALKMEAYFKEGLVNIAGGCCGTTPAHIAAIAEAAKAYPPRERPWPRAPATWLSALTALAVGGTNGEVSGGTNGEAKEPAIKIVGERTNAGENREFLAYLTEENYDDAVAVAVDMIEDGAALIGLCVDQVPQAGEGTMRNFLNFALQDPEFARVPLMIESGRWDLVEAGLQCVQGKCLVYSISLKDGPEEFLRRSGALRSYGAAAVVTLFDEGGPAESYERKIETARRSWHLLRDSGFPAGDIVFDPLLPAGVAESAESAETSATGDSPGADFIRACAWIRDNCPGAQIIGRAGALSPQGAFLKRARDAGLGMVIGDPAL